MFVDEYILKLSVMGYDMGVTRQSACLAITQSWWKVKFFLFNCTIIDQALTLIYYYAEDVLPVALLTQKKTKR